MSHHHLAAVSVALSLALAPVSAQELLTPAEETEFGSGPTMYEPLMKFVYDLEARSDLMSVQKVTETLRGRDVVLCMLSNPAVRRPADAINTNKPIVLIVNNVHGGEVAGKDASLILMRDLVLGPLKPLLDEAIVLVVPTINPDGAEVRRRTNEQGFDMNRDYLKHESQEISALVTQVINRWQPHLHVDTHHGGSAPYALVYQTCMNPAGDAELIRFGNERVLPNVRKALRSEDYDGYWYSGARGRGGEWSWRPTSVEPRKQHVYSTLANMVGFLFETPSNSHRVTDNGTKVVAIPREERYRHQVRGQYLGLRTMVEFAANDGDALMTVVADAKRRATANGSVVSADDQIVIDYEQVEKFQDEFWVRDRESEENAGYKLVTGAVMTKFVPTKTVTRPYGYLLPPKMAKVIPTLLDHEISVKSLLEPVKVEVDELYAAEVSERSYYQGHYLKRVVTASKTTEREFPAGSFFIPMAQPKSNLIGYLLEPETNDSLATWNYLDDFIRVRTPRTSDTSEASARRWSGRAAGRPTEAAEAKPTAKPDESAKPGEPAKAEESGQTGGRPTTGENRRGRFWSSRRSQSQLGQRIPIYRVMKETALPGVFVDHFDAANRRRYLRK